MDKNEIGMHIIEQERIDNTGAICAYVCPNCGNTDEATIKKYDRSTDSLTVRTHGGFGYKIYKWTPHRCDVCKCTFIAYQTSSGINTGVIVDIAFVVLFATILSIGVVVAITCHPIWWILCGACALFIYNFALRINEDTDIRDLGLASVDLYLQEHNLISKPIFFVGDRVILRHPTRYGDDYDGWRVVDGDMNEYIGKVGTVESIDPKDKLPIKVRFDTQYRLCGTEIRNYWFCKPTWLSLAEDEECDDDEKMKTNEKNV